MNIITAAIAEPISVEIARKQCRIDGDYDDDLLQVFITAAREWAETEIGRVIAPALVQSTANAFPADVASVAGTLTLETGPVQGIASIVYDDEDEAEQTLDPALYTVDQTGEFPVIRLVSSESWPATATIANAVRVRYTAGYSAAGDSPLAYPLPSRIKVAILLVLAHFYAHRQNTIEQNLQILPMGAANILAGLRLRRGFA